MNKTALAPLEQQALQSLVDYLQKTIPDQLEVLALFGSKARGDSQKTLILMCW